MATKQEILAEIRDNYGDTINIKQVAAVFNCSRNTVPKYLEGVPYQKTGNEKKYLAVDIAQWIFDRMTYE